MCKSNDVTGTVTWSTNTGCGTTAVTSGNPGVATCTTSSATRLPVGTDTVTATYSGDSNHSGSTGSVTQVVNGGIATTINVTNVSPSSEDFGADTPVTITAVSVVDGTRCGADGEQRHNRRQRKRHLRSDQLRQRRVNDTITCTATYTPTNADVAGTYTETAAFSGDTNYRSRAVRKPTTSPSMRPRRPRWSTSSGNPSTYGQSVTFTATVTGENGAVKGRQEPREVADVTGTVTWSANTGCSASTVTRRYPGVATCTTSSLNAGSDTVTATYSGDANHGGSSGSVSQTVNHGDGDGNAQQPDADLHGSGAFADGDDDSFGLEL